MIDFSDKQAIFNAIKQASVDNQATWALSADINTLVHKLNKEIDAKQAIVESFKGNKVVRTPLSEDATDTDIRARARLLLMDKLNDGTITAAEFAQFKDVFGLASAADQTSIITESFKDTVIDCPACGSNVYAPLPIEPDEPAQK